MKSVALIVPNPLGSVTSVRPGPASVIICYGSGSSLLFSEPLCYQIDIAKFYFLDPKLFTRKNLCTVLR